MIAPDPGVTTPDPGVPGVTGDSGVLGLAPMEISPGSPSSLSLLKTNRFSKIFF